MWERNRLALLFFIAIIAASALLFYAARKTGNAGFPGSILSDVPEHSRQQEHGPANGTIGYNREHTNWRHSE